MTGTTSFASAALTVDTKLGRRSGARGLVGGVGAAAGFGARGLENDRWSRLAFLALATSSSSFL